jgi:hypothetical protein
MTIKTDAGGHGRWSGLRRVEEHEADFAGR